MFRYCLLGGDTAAPIGLYANLCHAFLFISVLPWLLRGHVASIITTNGISLHSHKLRNVVSIRQSHGALHVVDITLSFD